MKSKLLTTVLLAPLAALLVVACERDFATEQSQRAALGVNSSDLCVTSPKVKQSEMDGVLYVRGTRGNDDINCSGVGLPVNVTGGFGDDLIIGSAQGDVVTAGDGNDQVFGGEGADDLSGGRGCDYVDGEGGDDVEVDGGPDDDDDFCSFVNPAGEVVTGGVFGGPGNDLLNGGPGDDYLNGGTGDDLLNGNNGDDTLDGGDGTDTCNGGKGADSYTPLAFPFTCEVINDPDGPPSPPV